MRKLVLLLLLSSSCFTPEGAPLASDSGGASTTVLMTSTSMAGSSPTSTTTGSTTGGTDQATMDGATGTTTGSTTGGTDQATMGGATGTTTATSPTTGIPNVCGDGVVGPEEECDDGNMIDYDECDNCVAPRWVFLGKQHNGALGGIVGADAMCAADAALAGLDRPGAQWLAWLADGSDSPAQRFDKTFTGWYRVPGAPPTYVAKGWQGLTSGALLHSIDALADGTKMAPNAVYAWSNVDKNGDAVDDRSCEGWTQDFNASGNCGKIDEPLSSYWTYINFLNCATPAYLYCFQQ